MENCNIADLDSIYFIGICGISMSALAKYMASLKKKVGGSDKNMSPIAAELKSLGISVNGGGTDALKNYEAVVYTDAVKNCDEELKLARALGKKIYPRGKFLREVSSQFANVIAVSGCHGKTTCTSMLAHIFAAAGKKFGAHIGGYDLSFGNFVCCGKDYFITEACEYKKNFLYLKPTTAIVLNTGADHLECYGSEEELKKAYTKFAQSANIAVCRCQDMCAKGAVTFGLREEADFRAENLKNHSGRYSFSALAYGKVLGEVNLSVSGRHNVLNALAAIAAAASNGIGFDDIKIGLEDFKGVERRMEVISERGGVQYIADYAHHPDEIKAALKTIKKMCGGNVYVVFQPHTYSRTKNLFAQFVSALTGTRRLMIYRTFAAREYYDDEGSALTLSKAIKKCRYGEQPEDIVSFISRAESGDAVLFLGAGDIYYIAKDILASLAC